MNLWIFETETVQQMLREARRIWKTHYQEETRRIVLPVIEELISELRARHADIDA